MCAVLPSSVVPLACLPRNRSLSGVPRRELGAGHGREDRGEHGHARQAHLLPHPQAGFAWPRRRDRRCRSDVLGTRLGWQPPSADRHGGADTCPGAADRVAVHGVATHGDQAGDRRTDHGAADAEVGRRDRRGDRCQGAGDQLGRGQLQASAGEVRSGVGDGDWTRGSLRAVITRPSFRVGAVAYPPRLTALTDSAVGCDGHLRALETVITYGDPMDDRHAWERPGAFEEAPGVYRIPLPLPNDGLKAVNVYAIADGAQVVLIDGGWALAQSEAAARTVAGHHRLRPGRRPGVPRHAPAPRPLHAGRRDPAQSSAHAVAVGEGERACLEVIQRLGD